MLQGDATYLIVTNEGQIEKYGLNAVCTHLGCVVPWNKVRPSTRQCFAIHQHWSVRQLLCGSVGGRWRQLLGGNAGMRRRRRGTRPPARRLLCAALAFPCCCCCMQCQAAALLNAVHSVAVAHLSAVPAGREQVHVPLPRLAVQRRGVSRRGSCDATCCAAQRVHRLHFCRGCPSELAAGDCSIAARQLHQESASLRGKPLTTPPATPLCPPAARRSAAPPRCPWPWRTAT